MPLPRPVSINCVHCGAEYKLVRVEGESEQINVACVHCGNSLPARDGQFILKYFMVKSPTPS
jgi:hypothetical protein